MPLILLAQSLPFPSRSGDAVRPVKGRICASESGTRILLERGCINCANGDKQAAPDTFQEISRSKRLAGVRNRTGRASRHVV